MLGTILSILFIGDSLSIETGNAFKELSRPAVVSVFSKVSSGLNSPLFFNWNTQAEALNSTYNPDVIIIMIGANDSPCFKYSERVETLLSKFPGKPVYWVSVLPFAHSFLWKRTEKNNEVLSKILGDRFIDVTSAIGSSTGKFTAKKYGQRIRLDDGVHLTPAGGKLIAHEILKQLKEKNVL